MNYLRYTSCHGKKKYRNLSVSEKKNSKNLGRKSADVIGIIDLEIAIDSSKIISL